VRSWIGAGVLAFGTILTLAQDAPVPPSELELVLQPDAPSKGLPRGFTVLLLNKSDHDIRVPTPVVDCQAAYSGVMGVSFRFTPLRPARPNSHGYGCASDRFNWPPILERAKEWTVLHPRMSISVRETLEQMHCECTVPGRYEFWAGYLPPDISPEDKETLTKAGIDFPHAPLESAHVTYVKKQ
jgi:hypothetical protein